MSGVLQRNLYLMRKWSIHYCFKYCGKMSYPTSSSEELILRHTVVSNNNLTPEIKLRLITRGTEAWHTPIAPGSSHPLGEPFWAFYWPGGQGISRYILDHPNIVKGKRVLDFGCGSGVNAIASLMCGAKEAIANDIDPLALVAAKLNAELNDVRKLKVSDENLLGSTCSNFDVILVGDMMYDSGLAETIFHWCRKLVSQNKVVLIGDPGRFPMVQCFSSLGSKLCTIGKYELDNLTKEDNAGFSSAFVYMLL